MAILIFCIQILFGHYNKWIEKYNKIDCVKNLVIVTQDGKKRKVPNDALGKYICKRSYYKNLNTFIREDQEKRLNLYKSLLQEHNIETKKSKTTIHNFKEVIKETQKSLHKILTLSRI